VVDVNSSPDLVEDYLDQLYVSLRTTPREARRIIAEAEDHLRESVEAGLAAGLTEREAQEAAVSSFGSVRAVARAHARRFPPVAVLGELVLAAWKLGSIALLGVAGSGVVALIMNVLLGRQFVGGNPAISRPIPAARCHYWMSIWPAAHSCAQAAMLETSSDAVSLRMVALIPGLIALEGYVFARRFLRKRGWQGNVLPDGFVPTVAACLFGALTAGLTWSSFRAANYGMNGGPGTYLSGAIVTLAVAVCYVPALRRTLLRHAYG
jgi:hypothetical protein